MLKKILVVVLIGISMTASAKMAVVVRPIHHPIVHRPIIVKRHPHHIPSMKTAFCAGFLGSVVGSAIVNVPKTAVVVQPQVVQPQVVQPQVVQPSVIVNGVQLVWVNGHYENTILPDGTVVKKWIPGQYIPVQD